MDLIKILWAYWKQYFFIRFSSFSHSSIFMSPQTQKGNKTYDDEKKQKFVCFFFDKTMKSFTMIREIVLCFSVVDEQKLSWNSLTPWI